MSDSSHLVMPEDHMERLYRSGNPLVRFVHVNRLRQIVAAMPRAHRLRVLDAGCGEGHLIEMLHDADDTHTYHGIDVTPGALEKARTRCPFAEFQRMDLTRIAFGEASFDVVVCTEVLEHVVDCAAAVRELRRVLKPDGHLIITFPNEVLWTAARFLLGRRPIRVPDHVNRLFPEEMTALTGMELVSQRNLPFGLPFPVSLGCLMKLRRRG